MDEVYIKYFLCEFNDAYTFVIAASGEVMSNQ
jgi:hypothetical protein